MEASNIIGEQIAGLKVLRLSTTDAGGNRYYDCECVRCKREVKNVLESDLLQHRRLCCDLCNRRDLTGFKFGRLTVLRKDDNKTTSGSTRWICRCSCPNKTEVSVLRGGLISNGVRSCGCYRRDKRAKDLTGMTFGRLKVIRRLVEKDKYGNYLWECKCSCPNETRVVVAAHTLLGNHTKSCGCARTETIIAKCTKWKTRIDKLLARRFKGMMARCYNKNESHYPRWGGRGITICKEWLDDRSKFVEWAKTHGFKPGLSIERIDNDGPYAPWNCRWVDDYEQANNTRKNHFITLDGQTMTLAQWSRASGMSYDKLKRMVYANKSEKEILSKMKEYSFDQNTVYEFLKLLIETGGVHYVDENQTIFRRSDRTPVGIKVGNGKDNRKLIALFKEGCKPPVNAVYLNPFDELLGEHPERDWFMNVITIIPGCIALFTMKSMTEMILSNNKDAEFASAEVIAPFVDKVDNKFLNELQKIRPLDVGMIFYDKQKHVSQLLCDFWEESFEEKMKSKIRKSSLKTMREMLTAIYKTETPHEMTYTATLVPCPRFDAVVHVLSEALTRMTDVVEKTTEIKLRAAELAAHLEHLEAYHKALQWLATSTTTKPTEETPAETPWSVNPVGALGNVVPVGSSSTGIAGATAVVPAGITRNPSFGVPSAGVVRNPSFGGPTMFGGIGGVAPVIPSTPGLGAVVPVTPAVPTFDMSKIATDAFASMSYDSGFAGGFL